MYVIITVNFGEKPVGCIAIATTSKKVRLFGGIKDDGVWFLTKRTKVDDATAGADTLEELHKLSKEME